jgi:spermidine/putrescine transport system ATP-binding protein
MSAELRGVHESTQRPPTAPDPELAANGRSPAIAVEGLTKRYGETLALDTCTLQIARGEFVSLLGPSGCGKTTLLRLIGGFVRPDGGTIRLLGSSVDGLPPNRRPVNTVFQGYALFPHRTVAQNVAFPLEVSGVPASERRLRVREALDLVRLPDIGERKPSELSGGQSQRVALARALVGRPGVLLLDEPLAALDLKLRQTMQLELRRIQEELGTTFLYVTHDQEEALTMSDRVFLMNAGRIVQDGAPREIYDRPATVFASSFVGEANLLEAAVVHGTPEATVVRAGAIELEGPPGTMAAGTDVVVSVRPEAIRLGAVAAGPNCFDATVRRLIFLGPLVRVVVELVPGTTLTLAVGRDQADGLVEGAAVDIGFPRSAVHILPAS